MLSTFIKIAFAVGCMIAGYRNIKSAGGELLGGGSAGASTSSAGVAGGGLSIEEEREAVRAQRIARLSQTAPEGDGGGRAGARHTGAYAAAMAQAMGQAKDVD